MDTKTNIVTFLLRVTRRLIIFNCFSIDVLQSVKGTCLSLCRDEIGMTRVIFQAN